MNDIEGRRVGDAPVTRDSNPKTSCGSPAIVLCCSHSFLLLPSPAGLPIPSFPSSSPSYSPVLPVALHCTGPGAGPTGRGGVVRGMCTPAWGPPCPGLPGAPSHDSPDQAPPRAPPPLVHLRFPTLTYLESLLLLFYLAPHPTLAHLGAPTHLSPVYGVTSLPWLTWPGVSASSCSNSSARAKGSSCVSGESNCSRNRG